MKRNKDFIKIKKIINFNYYQNGYLVIKSIFD